MMIVIKRMNIDELLGNDKQEYTYFKRESPNGESKSETGNNTRVSEEINGNPIKTDKIVIDGKEYHGESIDKALERARLLKNAIEKGIITDEEYTTAIDDLANGLEQERQEQEIEDYYQTITNGLKTRAERTGESMQLIIDRMQGIHNGLKEPEEPKKIESRKESQEIIEARKASIKNHISHLLYPIQRWLEENHPDYVIMISSDHISVVNRRVTK